MPRRECPAQCRSEPSNSTSSRKIFSKRYFCHDVVCSHLSCNSLGDLCPPPFEELNEQCLYLAWSFHWELLGISNERNRRVMEKGAGMGPNCKSAERSGGIHGESLAKRKSGARTSIKSYSWSWPGIGYSRFLPPLCPSLVPGW